jgi:hypothetical protein
MKHLFTAISAIVLLAPPAYGDPQKPAATQPTYTRANKAQADISKSNSDTTNAIVKHIAGRKAPPPSNKTHGALGGDLQKPAATQSSRLNAGGVNPAVRARDKALGNAKVNPPSNKTHGVLGGGVLDQGSGLGQSGPAPAGALTATGAPVARGQVIK